MHIPPHEYAAEAGWELTPEGGKRLLYWPDCYELDLSYQPPDAWKPDAGTCGWCGLPLFTLLDLDVRDPRLASLASRMGADATRLRIATCLSCSWFATAFTDIDSHGGSTWSAANGPKPAILAQVGNGDDNDLPPEIISRRMTLGAPRKTPFEALGGLTMGNQTGISQVGGHPGWVQDAEYPVCPGCGWRMECAGQVSWEDYGGFEGSTYAYVCLPCGKAATSYQQT